MLSYFKKDSCSQIIGKGGSQTAQQAKILQHSFFNEYIRPPLSILKSAIGQDQKFAQLFSDEFFDSLLGMFNLNNREIIIHSPLHKYFYEIRLGLKQLERNFQPLLLKIAQKFSNFTEVTGSGLFPLYSMMNHTCGEVYAVASLNISMDRTDWENAFAQSSVYAAKDIESGEELYVSYVDMRLGQAQKKQTVAKYYAFACKCKYCISV